MPNVGAAAAASGVQFEERRHPLGRTEHRMWHQLSETSGKALMLGVIEMALIAEEDHLVLEQ